MTNDNIDSFIQYNSDKYNIDPIWSPNSKYLMETNSSYSCPFQCALFTANNTDKFFEYLSITLKSATSLSIVISGYFAREIIPIILSREQKQLLPQALFLYVLCSDIHNYFDWILGYHESNSPSATPYLLLFNDVKDLFVRLLNDVSCHLTLVGDTRHRQKEYWHALQYYSAARQIFSIPFLGIRLILYMNLTTLTSL